MHDTPTQSTGRLDEIIGEYLCAQEGGTPPARDELLRQHPDLAEELQEFFANQDRLNAAAGGLPGELPQRKFVPPRVRYFGDYELLDEIARGGMGVVNRAKQTTLNRIVAIKMILSGHLAGEDDVIRFRTEAEAAANLKHPGIVPVHEVGMHDGHHYFSMDYIEGRSLAKIVRENPVPAQKAAEYVRAIADAVEYAHQQGTLHRDLKPSNILIDAEDQTHVTDFGLAIRVDADPELTRTGQILGTPAYMAPEQAQGKRGLIGPAVDVYSLGAILYELLTGRPPFKGVSSVETLRLVTESEPVSPRLLNPKVPRDLETICLKCLEKDAHKRYSTAGELREELRRFQDDEPIRARPVGPIERTWRWCRRNPSTAGLLGSVFLLVIAVVSDALNIVGSREDTPQHSPAYNEPPTRTESPRQLHDSDGEVGRLVYLKSIVRDDLKSTVSVEISSDGRFVYAPSWDAIAVFERDPESGDLTHTQTITSSDQMNAFSCVRLSDDGRLAATTAFRSNKVLLFPRDPDTGTLSEPDVARDEERGVAGLRSAIDAKFSRNSRFLYVIAPGGLSWFRITEQNKLEFIGVARGENACFDDPRGICLSADGEWLYVVSPTSGTLVTLNVDTDTGNPIIVEIIHNDSDVHGLDGVFSVTCSSEGRFVYTNSGRFGGDNAVCTFERRDELLVFLEAHRDSENGVQGLAGGNELAVSPDGLNLYALGSVAGAIACFDRDPLTGRLHYRNVAGVGHLGLVSGIALSPDGRHAYAAAERDNAISIFERR